MRKKTHQERRDRAERRKRSKVNLTQKFERVKTKSKAGVEYTHYKPYLTGVPSKGPNRATRRRVVKPLKPSKFNNPAWNAKKEATKARVKRQQDRAHARAVERKAKAKELSPKN